METNKTLEKKIIQEYNVVKSIRKVAKTFHVCAKRVSRILKRNNIKLAVNNQPKLEILEIHTDKDTQSITLNRTRIKTLEEALKYTEVDLSIWEVDRYIINKWEMGYKDKNANASTIPLFQIKIWLIRKVPKPIHDSIKEYFKKIPKAKLPKITHKQKKDPHLLEISLYDAHLGKLAWLPETENNYDHAIAEQLMLKAVDDLIHKVSNFDIDQIIFPVGQDFFHVNNWINTTAHDTRQDVDGRFQKLFTLGIDIFIQLAKKCRVVAPVRFLYVPGNHDMATSFYLCCALYHHFISDKYVTVDKSPTYRKYIRYGTNLIGYTHGSEEKHASLPLVMAQERSADWAITTNRSWHVGHLHKRAETRYVAGDTHVGVPVVTIPSLAGTDAWHYSKGYVKTMRVAEAHLWNRDNGYVGFFATNNKLFEE